MMSFVDLPDPLSKPSIADFSVLCRICLRKGSIKVKIQPIGAYIDMMDPERQQNLYEKIRICSDIKIEENEELPNNICDKCVNLLLIAYYFKTLSTASDKILRNILISKDCDEQDRNRSPCTKIKIESENHFDCDEDHTSWSDVHLYSTEKSILNNLDDDLNNTVYICDICQQEFSDKSSLSVHLNYHNITDSSIVKDNRLYFNKIKNKITTKTRMSQNGENNKLNKNKNKGNLKRVKSNKLENVNKNKEIKIENDNLDAKDDMNNTEDKVTGYFECLLCNTSFSYKEDLARHMFSHDNSSKYKCYGCDVVFDKYSERTHHEKYYCPKMPPGTKYECSKCKAQCDNRFRFDTHVKFGCAYKPMRLDSKTIELEPLLKCQHCDLTTMNKATLRNHILNCHTENKPYICEICGKGYAMVSSLNSHRKQSHTTEKKYKCSYCPYAARQQSSLNVHTRRHTLEYRYSCEICGASFKQNTGYHIHMRRYHKEKEHQCEICKKMFSEKAAMKQHVSSVHLGLKPHECKVCGAAFSRKRSLKAHLFRAHNIAMAKNALYEKVVQVSALPNNEAMNL